jgi:quinolinate synthase
LLIADFIGSTQALLNYATLSEKTSFLVATESGILHEMKKQNPDKEFIPVPPNDSTCACNECNFMRLNTLEKLYNCLLNETSEIMVDEEIRVKAVKPILRMLEMS